jgi:AcrR family transcriptional regulator
MPETGQAEIHAEERGSARERGEATRRHIIEVAAAAFSDHGYAGTSLNDVIRAAGVTKGAFYHHFPSKESLALDVVSTKQQDWAGRVISAGMRHPRAVDQIRAMCEALCDLHELDPAAQALQRLCVEMSENRDLAPTLTAQFTQWIDLTAAVVRRAQEQGDIRSEVDAQVAAEVAVAMVQGIEQMSGATTGQADLRPRMMRAVDFLLDALRPTAAGSEPTDRSA